MQLLQIKEIKIKTTVDETYQCGSLEVVMRADAERPAFLCARLLTKEGQEADHILPVAVEPEMDFCLQASPVQLWNAESVCLYDLVLELLDERMRLLGSTVKKIAFCRWEREQENPTLNGHALRWRVKQAPPELAGMEEDGQRDWLRTVKRGGYNAVYAASKETRGALYELCLEYGLYLAGETETGCLNAAREQADADPDFELSVTQEGVLVENHSIFINADLFDLKYTLRGAQGQLCAGHMTADVPPGSGRYIELPFAQPREAGEYTYRAALCLREDTLWAASGEEVAAAETVLSNLFSEN